MKFPKPLIRATLIKRYKRFLADMTLEDGRVATAHCANSGSMKGVCAPGSTVWLSTSDNPKRKLKYSWELIEVDGHLVGINTSRPNDLVAEAIESGKIPALAGYHSMRREAAYGGNSRIDVLLEDAQKPACYVEVKNVTLKLEQEGLAAFPDAVTARGAKHLAALSEMAALGRRAVMLYLVQREDCSAFTIAGAIDPTYDAELRLALSNGVEALCYGCRLSTNGIELARPMPIRL